MTSPTPKPDTQLPDWAFKENRAGLSLAKPARYKGLRGGRGSSKSWTVANFMVLRMAGAMAQFGYSPEPVRIASVRDYSVTLKESVKQIVEQFITRYEYRRPDLFLDRMSRPKFKVRDTWIDHANGSRMIFPPGIERRLLGFPSMEGIDVFWVEQAEFLTFEMMDFLDPTIRKRGAELWFTWNPQQRAEWCWQWFVAKPKPENVSLWINWRHNPWWYSHTDLERLRRRDEEERPHIYAWKWEGHPNDGGADKWLPYASLRKCVRAYTEGLGPKLHPDGRKYGGLDYAEGGDDNCALVIRHGPYVRKVVEWPGTSHDLGPASRRAWSECRGHTIIRVYYDASSPGTGELRRAGFSGITPVWFGGAVGGPDEEYEPGRPNSEVFARKNSQMAGATRLRMTRTLRLLDGKPVNPMDCLFIPDDTPDLEAVLAEWSQPARHLTTREQWEIEKAPKTPAGKETDSPDRFDALSLSFGLDTDERGLIATR